MESVQIFGVQFLLSLIGYGTLDLLIKRSR